MRHLFQIMFTAALLLGSLILFNNQESEVSSLATETPFVELMDLQAELASVHIATAPDLHYWLPLSKLKGSISNKLNPLALQHLAGQEDCIQKQIRIHLELKPLIANQSGQYIHNRSRCDDPPVS